METIWEEPRKPTGIINRLDKLEEELKLKEMKEVDDNERKPLKIPFGWKRKMRDKKNNIIVLFLNMKNELEPPVVVPIQHTNIIMYKEKAYEFDPRAVLTMQLGKKNPKLIIIREMDRRPVCNLDWNDVKIRGDATDSDEILIKMVQTEKQKPKAEIKGGMIWLILLIIVGAVIFFLVKK